MAQKFSCVVGTAEEFQGHGVGQRTRSHNDHNGNVKDSTARELLKVVVVVVEHRLTWHKLQ